MNIESDSVVNWFVGVDRKKVADILFISYDYARKFCSHDAMTEEQRIKIIVKAGFVHMVYDNLSDHVKRLYSIEDKYRDYLEKIERSICFLREYDNSLSQKILKEEANEALRKLKDISNYMLINDLAFNAQTTIPAILHQMKTLTCFNGDINAVENHHRFIEYMDEKIKKMKEENETN